LLNFLYVMKIVAEMAVDAAHARIPGFGEA